MLDSLMPQPLSCTLFPYTTLFRSCVACPQDRDLARRRAQRDRQIDPGRGVGIGAPDDLVGAVDREARGARDDRVPGVDQRPLQDRKSTRLNSSHVEISYAVFCLKK